ncbi:hypothetical protein, unlikely [Trypanosoma congolense IL3000]|uniref:Uncharacterized protein n=1 Tax=Trypanosoma congolense (strain IL3000) TaxID=1068625 RepID=F9WI98_TRYCI|nr:hypothetical protein, unlikely [Trypanosoma congolense IL3000]
MAFLFRQAWSPSIHHRSKYHYHFSPTITLGATLPHCAVMIETPARNVFSQSRHLPQSPNITMKSSGNSWCVWGTRMESDRHCLNSVRTFGTQCPSTYACYLPVDCMSCLTMIHKNRKVGGREFPLFT